jgi:hypothetical protein
MTDTGYYGPPPVDTVDAPASRRLRNRVIIGGGVLAVVSVVVFFVSLIPFSTEPGTCDAWAACRSSARDQWMWTARPWTVLAVGVSAFVSWWAFAWQPLLNRPTLRKVASIICIVITIPIIAVSLFFAAVLMDCSGGSWFCGPELSALAASPALVAGVVMAALIAGLRMKDPARRAQVSTVTLLLISGVFVACLAGTIIASTVLSVV